MPDNRRIRIAPDLEARIHRFAIRQNRPFDNAAKHLLSIGLDAVAANTSPSTHARDHRSGI